MIDEKQYETAMGIITNAGTAKSCALMAIDEAAESNFEEAEKLLAEASRSMHAAHDVQMDMISSEAKGSSVDLSLILVHAEDHLTMAIVTSDLAARMVELYRRLAASAD